VGMKEGGGRRGDQRAEGGGEGGGVKNKDSYEKAVELTKGKSKKSTRPFQNRF